MATNYIKPQDTPPSGDTPRNRFFMARFNSLIRGSPTGSIHRSDAGIATIIFKISMIVFAVEGCIMFLIEAMDPLLASVGITSPVGLALIDAMLLVAIAGPMIGVWVVLPDVRAREHAEVMLRSAIENMSEGFVLYDADDRLVTWNEKWLELHRDIGDLVVVGSKFEDLFRAKMERNSLPDTSGMEELSIAARLAAHRKPGNPILRQTPDGCWYIIREARTEDGQYIGLNIDITDLKKAENTAQEARLIAEQAVNAKSTFLANMSHELRTPLNAVIGFANAIKNRRQLNIDESNISDYIDAIHSSGQHLLRLINDLLDFSKIEAGKMELLEENLNLTRLLDELGEQFLAQARNEGLRFFRSTPADLPNIRGDVLRLRQILLNLYSNAVKFTPHGGAVTLGVDLLDDGALTVFLTDTGIGMDEEELRMLGETFRQFGGAFVREQAGTGLGVSIAMALVRLHGGRLEYESVPGKGTTVTLVLPPERVLPAKGVAMASG